MDLRKSAIEVPLKKIIHGTPLSSLSTSAQELYNPVPVAAKSAHEIGTTRRGESANRSAEKFANPKVVPGKVAWHAGFDAAREAAKKSGKPVLLFQMMGQLDDRYC